MSSSLISRTVRIGGLFALGIGIQVSLLKVVTLIRRAIEGEVIDPNQVRWRVINIHGVFRVHVLSLLIQEYISPSDEIIWDGAPIGITRDLNDGLFEEMKRILEYRIRAGTCNGNSLFWYKRGLSYEKIKCVEEERKRISKALSTPKGIRIGVNLIMKSTEKNVDAYPSVMFESHPVCPQCRLENVHG